MKAERLIETACQSGRGELFQCLDMSAQFACHSERRAGPPGATRVTVRGRRQLFGADRTHGPAIMTRHQADSILVGWPNEMIPTNKNVLTEPGGLIS